MTQLSPIIVLKKHIDLKPQLTVVISSVNGSIQCDFSSPGTLGELLLMKRIMEMQIDKIILGQAGQPVVSNPTG